MSDKVTEQAAGKKMGPVGKGCMILIAVFVGLGILGAIVGGDEKAETTAGLSDASAPSAGTAQATATPDAASTLTGPQKNAVRTAKQYLEFSGFSRKGLIDQLSSDAGSGFELADATAAVDSLDIDWNEQAVRSAKDYLEMTGFSCKGLIQQLSSSAGSKFTKEEATYGAQQAGAC